MESSPQKIIRLLDRTRTVTDWKCPRARYWGYEYKGRGIVKEGLSLELFMGIIIHDALAAIATLHLNDKVVDIDAIGDMAFLQVKNELMENQTILQKEGLEFANEQGALCEGLIRGFYKYMWPKLLAMYPKIVCVEQEMEYPLMLSDGLDIVFMTKPDLIVETPEGDLVYIEYKSTSSKKDKWIKSWDTQVQLHSSVKATEFSLGKLPAAVQIVGLYKGYESYGKQSSPFCYGYLKRGNPPFTKDEVVYEYKAGYRRTATWETEGGVKAWVNAMPDEILANQFPLTPQIFVNEDLVGSFFKQRLVREQQITEAGQVGDYDDPVTGIDAVYPQRWDSCEPSFGWACQYKKLCHGYVEDPTKEGYQLRVPHHEQELEALGLQNDYTGV